MKKIFTLALLVSLWIPNFGFTYSIESAEEDLRNLNYDSVLQELKPEQFTQAADRVYCLYLLATAAYGKEQYDQAVQYYDRILTEFPKSRWGVKSVYRKADCLMFLKRFEEAEAIYEKGVQGLLGQKRREEIANIYIRHADRFFKPEKKDQAPQYDRARTLYERARDILPNGARWERACYQIAMTFIQQENWAEADKTLTALIQYYESPNWIATATVPSETPEIVNPYPEGGYQDDARLQRGEALLRLNNPVEARKVWKKLRDNRREITKRPDIVAEAAFRIAKTYGIPKPANDRDLVQGIRSLDEYISLFPNHAQVPTAAMQKAEAYFNRNQWSPSLAAYQDFLNRFNAKATPETKSQAETQIAQCLARQEKFDDAVAAYEKYLSRHPVDKNWREAQQAIVDIRYRKLESLQRNAEKEFARWVRKEEQDKHDPNQQPIPAALLTLFQNLRQGYESFMQTYPLDARLPNLQVRLGKNERMLRRYPEATAQWKETAAKFPNTDPASESLYLIAETTEFDLKDYEKALDLYKEVTFGSFQGKANERIAALQQVNLNVRTERTFYTTESPVIQISTRNIDRYTCKLYPLDMQAYFETTQGIRKIENLDIHVIAPEKVWEVTPENYLPYKLIEQKIPIPVQGPGAWLVKVESKTLEAVTLVGLSNLAIVIKGGKNEALVYAEDQLKETGVEGADVFISDGKTVIARGKTNHDGVYQIPKLQAKEAEQLSVFAAKEGHWAGESLRIRNLTESSALQPRVLIYTDRPAYQPGEEIQFRAMIREIQDGHYFIPKEYEYVTEVVDARGTLIHKQTDKLSEFGTLNGRLQLDAEAPAGGYRISVSRKNGPSGAWEFQVQEFTLPTARIEIETERTTVFYGDPIRGTLKISDFSGNPLAGERVQYALAAEIQDSTTDLQGKISFQFETWDLPEEGAAIISAVLPDRQIQNRKIVALVQTGFSISLKTTRSLYLAGEPFHVQVTAQSRNEKRDRIAVPIKVKLQKRNDEGAYEVVDTKEVTTSADERQTASVTFTAKTGGRYKVTAEGLDERKTLVTTESSLRIAGEEDENKLLILSDKSEFQQGETASLIVVSRLPNHLVLITGEREGIVEYRLQKLQEGKNTLTWKLDERCSPACTISVAAMADHKLYQHSVQLNVQRGMDVTIAVGPQKFSPRDTAELQIQTRDHNGKAVAAEMSLGLIDAALLALFPDRLENVKGFFDQSVRGNFLATTSSANFYYPGITRPISKDLLRDREIAGKEILAEGETEAGGMRAGREMRREVVPVEGVPAVQLAAGVESRPTAPPATAAATELGFVTLDVAASSAQPLDQLNRGAKVDNVPIAQARVELGQNVQQERYAGYQANTANALSNVALKYNEKSDRGNIQTQYFFAGDLAVAGQGGGAGGGMYLGGGYGAFGGAAISRSYFPETAYFNPAIITDDSGKAVVHINLPDSLTTWQVQAIAITPDTLVNQGKKDIIVDKPFRVEIDVPGFVREGDKASGVAIVRNYTGEKHAAKTVYTQTVSGRPIQKEWKSTLDIGGFDKQEIALTSATVGAATLTLKSQTDKEADEIQQPLAVKPWGIPVRVGDSGIAGQSLVKELSLPAQTDYSSLRMWITLGGSGTISMLEAAWRPGFNEQSTRATVEKGLAALAAWDCAEQTKRTDLVPVETLRKFVESAVRHAIAAQSDAGLWSWAGGRNSQPDILTTGRVAELLHHAKEHGFSVPDKVLELTTAQLEKVYQETADENEKVRILYAQSQIASPNFTFVNRVHRGLSQLNRYDAALLGLTWINMGRIEKAQEVWNELTGKLSGIEKKTIAPTPTVVQPMPQQNSFEAVVAGARLYFLLPASVRTDAITQYLLNQLTIEPLAKIIEPAIGLRIQALAAYLAAAAEEQSSFTLSVKVNGREAAKRSTQRSVLPNERIDIDPSLLKSAGNRIELAYTGTGKYRYSVVLEGWTKQNVKPQDWLEPQKRLFPHVTKTYEPIPLEYKHKEIPRGYSVIAGSYATIQNVLEEIPSGEAAQVRIQIHCQGIQNFLVVEEPLPSGFLPIKESISGNIDHYQINNDSITFYLRGPDSYFSLEYRLQAKYPGNYRIPAALITCAAEPESIYATDSRSIAVLHVGEKPKKAYNYTPDELYNLGLAYKTDNRLEEARELLTQLITSYTLQPQPYLETAKALFQIHLQGNDSQQLVRYFEIVKERDQNFEIEFAHIAKLAQAYRNIGENERAVYVFRSLLEGLFLQEGAVSGTLQEVGRYRDALDYAKQLILEYPDIPPVQTAVYNTGTVIYRNIEQWTRDPEFQKSNQDKKSLLAEAVGMIESFLALYPNHPVADEAGYTLLNLWLDQKNFSRVAQLAETYSKRFPNSTFLDSFDFLAAYALFELEKFDQALQIAQKVSTAEYPAPGGGKKHSEDANTAIHISGKILNASGALDQAIEQYQRVKDTFADAKEALAYLTDKGLKVEEVTVIRNQEPTKVTVRYKNLKQVELVVYKVDLMTFYLTERNLQRMSDIQLAGITPLRKQTLNFEKAKPHDWNEEKVDLNLTEPGAYLAVLRGNGISASGMVLRTNLDLEVQEDAPTGMVRITARSGAPAEYAKKVKMQVRGSFNDRFDSGETDLRGVFTAFNINGVATVLAQAGDQYGFYRGMQNLGQPPVPKDAEVSQKKAGVAKVQEKLEAGTPILGKPFNILGNNDARFRNLQEEQLRRWNSQTDYSNFAVKGQKAATLY